MGVGEGEEGEGDERMEVEEVEGDGEEREEVEGDGEEGEKGLNVKQTLKVGTERTVEVHANFCHLRELFL